MLKSRIRVDLPSTETDRKMGPLEWLRSSFGAEIDLKSGEEELTVSALTLTRSLVEGFQKGGVTNSIAFLVDKRVVYKDVNDEADDLRLIPEAADASGVLEEPFKEMHMVLTHSEGGIHFLFDVRILNKVVLGDEEMTVEVSGRIEELRIRRGETAVEYSERVKAFGADSSNAASNRQAFEARVEEIGRTLGAALTGSKVSVAKSHIELIQPSRRQIAHFRDLKFGDEVTQPTYRAVPTRQRAGAYSDPFYYYYYDPYYDFTHLYLLDSLHHHDAWQQPEVVVVSPEGEPLFLGDQAVSHAHELSALSGESISFSDGGDLVIADDVPMATGAAAGQDWGGDDVDETVETTESGGGRFLLQPRRSR